MTICSTAFLTLGRAQAQALGHPSLPIAEVPHPFGLQSREDVRLNAKTCVDDVVRQVSEGTS